MRLVQRGLIALLDLRIATVFHQREQAGAAEAFSRCQLGPPLSPGSFAQARHAAPSGLARKAAVPELPPVHVVAGDERRGVGKARRRLAIDNDPAVLDRAEVLLALVGGPQRRPLREVDAFRDPPALRLRDDGTFAGFGGRELQQLPHHVVAGMVLGGAPHGEVLEYLEVDFNRGHVVSATPLAANRYNSTISA